MIMQTCMLNRYIKCYAFQLLCDIMLIYVNDVFNVMYAGDIFSCPLYVCQIN